MDKDRCFDHQAPNFDDMCPGMENELVIDDNLLLGPGITPMDPDVIVLAPDLFQKRYELGFDPRDFYSRFRLTWEPLEDVPPFTEVFSAPDCTIADAEEGNCISHGEVEDYAPVPEPSSILGIIAFGGLGLTGLRKKR